MPASETTEQIVELFEKKHPNLNRFHIRQDSWRYLTEEDILGGSAVIDLIPGTTIFLKGGEEICEGSTTDLVFTFKGGPGPWSFVVMREYFNEYNMLDTERMVFTDVYDNPFRHKVSKPGRYYIESASGKGQCAAVNTPGNANVFIHHLPNTDLETNGILCLNGHGDIKMNLIGEAPWNIDLLFTDESGHNEAIKVSTHLFFISNQLITSFE